MKNLVKKAVIPVAGLGTRGLPFTKEVPKEFLPIIDTPTIHYIVEEVLAAGIEQVILVTGKGKSVLEDYFDPSPALESWLHKRGKTDLLERVRRIGTMCEIITVRQKEPLGLGHAVLCAEKAVGNERFAVCLGDEIFPPWDATNQNSAPLQRLVAASTTHESSVVGVVEIPLKDSRSYGILDLGGKPLGTEATPVKRTVEKPAPESAPSPYAIIGRYIFEPVLFEHLREVKPGTGGEIQLTDGMDRLCQQSRLRALLLSGCRYDIGNHFYYVKAQIDEALRRPELKDRLKEYLRTL
jgi:UTP--glucose-1-phosphate uridylyltransferase